MALVLKVVGAVWALIGATNIFSMLAKGGSGLGSMLGLIFNMVLFVLPGLGIYGIGVVVAKKEAPTGAQSAPSSADPKKVVGKKDWIDWLEMHPIAAVLLVILGLGVVVPMLKGSSSNSTPSASTAPRNNPTIKQIAAVPADYVGKSFEMTVNAKADKYYNYGFADETKYYSLKIWDDSTSEFEGIYAYIGKSKASKAVFEKLINDEAIIKIHGSIPESKYEQGSNAYFQIDGLELNQ